MVVATQSAAARITAILPRTEACQILWMSRPSFLSHTSSQSRKRAAGRTSPARIMSPINTVAQPGPGRGGEDQAANGDDGAEGDQVNPPYDVTLFVLPPATVTVLEALSRFALPELPPVLLYLLEHI